MLRQAWEVTCEDENTFCEHMNITRKEKASTRLQTPGTLVLEYQVSSRYPPGVQLADSLGPRASSSNMPYCSLTLIAKTRIRLRFSPGYMSRRILEICDQELVEDGGFGSSQSRVVGGDPVYGIRH